MVERAITTSPGGRQADGNGVAGALRRVGCSLLTFHDWSLEEALDRVRAHGFDRVDLAVVPGHCDHVDVLALSEARLEALGEALRSRGLTLSSVNLHPGDLSSADSGVTERRIRAAIEMGRHLGARVLTLPPGRAVPSAEWDDAARKVAKRIASFLDPAEKAGLALSIEAPHAYTLADDVEKASRLFELVGDRRITCTFDTSHVQRGNRLPLAEALPRLGVPIAHVHLRDTLRGEVTVTPGKGDCDYLPFLGALLASGYGGDFNFELEYEGGSREKVEQELRWAREHIRSLMQGEPLPLAHRVFRQEWFRALDGAAWSLRHPREFVVAHPSLKAALRPPVRFARRVRANWIPRSTARYRAGWGRAWRVGSLPSAIPLQTAAPAAGGGPETKVAILGCGYTGRFEHGPGFARLPGSRVVGVCDVQPERAALLAKQLGCPSFVDAAELLRSVRPDLVVNCTREWQHRDTTLMSFEAGADVFCEKILAESLESGQRMVQAARDQGRVLAVNYNWRFLPGIQRIRAVRDGGELGRLRMLRVLSHAWVHHHALDLAAFLGGPIASVSATYRDQPETRGLSAWNPYADQLLYMPTVYCSAAMETSEGVGVSFASTELLDPRGLQLALDAVFDEGTLTLTGVLDADAMGSLTASARKKIDLRMSRGDAPAGFALSFQRSIEAFAASYRARSAPPSSGEDALAVMRVENAIVRSHQTGARVLL